MSMLDIVNNDLFATQDDVSTATNLLLSGGSEALFTLADLEPTNSELPTEVDENGDVKEIPQQLQPAAVVIKARCPISISSVEADGVLKRVVTAHIRGPIEDMSGYVPLIDTLNRADENFVFIIRIQSGGGMITTGATIASAMIASKGHVITIAEGLCASAASLIWSSGDECVVTDYSMFMYHMSSHCDMGNSAQVGDNAYKMVNYVKHCLMKNPLKKGHITPDEHRTFCENKRDVWISADEMRAHLEAHTKGVQDVA